MASRKATSCSNELRPKKTSRVVRTDASACPGDSVMAKSGMPYVA